MIRLKINPRLDYKEKLSDLGFEFNENYWLENAAYSFSSKEIEEIEKATIECYNMYCLAVQHVIDNNLWDKLHIPAEMVPVIVDSWNSDELSLYGRFDFAFINGVPKCLEFNADTPTSLYEAAIVQWMWKEEVFPGNDQFNSIHEALIQSWMDIHAQYQSDMYYFACGKENLEDHTTTAYILSTAAEAGLNVTLMDIADIHSNDELFTDVDGNNLDVLFKLYPYEWMFNEEFGKTIPVCATTFIEPLWKAVMSNKYLLTIVAKLFPDSPYVLKASDQPLPGDYCKKPIFSREGANVTLVKNGEVLEETVGEYGEEGFIFQELVDIPSFDGMYPIIGSWVIGGESCGFGIRETSSRITDNMSYFVPHIIQ